MMQKDRKNILDPIVGKTVCNYSISPDGIVWVQFEDGTGMSVHCKTREVYCNAGSILENPLEKISI